MKNLLKLSLVGVVSFGLFMSSCQKETTVMDSNGDGISQEIIEKVESFALNPEGMYMGEIELPNGKTQPAFIVEDDIAISPEQLANLDLRDGITGEQYRTWNLVSSPRTITIIGYTGGSYALTSKMQTSLQWAVNNYNRLNIGITFNLTFGTDYQNKDMVVYKTSGAAGGMAGFPENGDPYKWIQIFSGTDSYNNNVIEHIITHEMGHCVGFRHTDYFSRASCGQNTNEGSAGVGAVHIPGTPTNYDSSSLMLSCFSGSEDGEFGSYDVVALEYLY